MQVQQTSRERPESNQAARLFARRRLLAYPLSHFKNRLRTEPDWILPGLLKRRNTGFVIGPPKRACKSWLLANLGWDLAEHKPLWGITHSKDGPVFLASRPMRTVYFTQEDTEDDFQDRSQLMFNAGRTVNDLLWIVPKNLKMLLDSPTGFQVILNEIGGVVTKSGPVDLVLFDPMRRMHAKSENDSEIIAALWQRLDELHCQFDCSTIFSHHVVKPPKDASSHFDPTSPFAARGSGDIFGGGDAFINVVPKGMRGQPRNYRDVELHFETKRGKPIAPVDVRISFETGGITFMSYLQGRHKDAPGAENG